MTSGGVTQMREWRAGNNFSSQQPQEVHFGLGPARVVDELRVRWPDGSVQSFTGVRADQFIVLGGAGVAQIQILGEELDFAHVPLGSALTELDQLSVKGYDGLSSVWEWLPASEPLESTERHISNEFGTFIQVDLGAYGDWKASAEERDTFTGEIRLLYFSMVIPDDLNPSFMISYVYVNGKLEQKDWGILPG